MLRRGSGTSVRARVPAAGDPTSCCAAPIRRLCSAGPGTALVVDVDPESLV